MFYELIATFVAGLGTAGVALLANRLRAADHHIVKQRGIQAVPIPDRFKQLRDKLDRRNFVQGAIGPPATARGADMIVDKYILHRCNSPESSNRHRAGRLGSAGPSLRVPGRHLSAGRDFPGILSLHVTSVRDQHVSVNRIR